MSLSTRENTTGSLLNYAFLDDEHFQSLVHVTDNIQMVNFNFSSDSSPSMIYVADPNCKGINITQNSSCEEKVINTVRLLGKEFPIVFHVDLDMVNMP